MATHRNNPTATNIEPGLQFSELKSKRRKGHFNKMSLMLLMFVGCSLTLILSPLHVQAKEMNNATSKGENMLSNDRQSHQHVEGETNINADKTNDNGIFKRLQPSDNKIENQETGEEEDEEDEHSSEVIEMIQPPHTLRHQEHYKQRIILAAKHKRQHLDATASDDDGDDDVKEQERELSQYNRNVRYQQIQQALSEPIAFSAPHHRRHEHHLAKQRLEKQTASTWPQQHHLRHQHHQQTQEFQYHNQPQLRHFKHEMRKQNLTVTNIKPLLPHQRYFDRESSNVNPPANDLTTEGPHLRHTGSKVHWKPITYSSNPHNRLFNDGGNKNQEDEKELKEKDVDIKRFSLSLGGHESELDKENANKGKKILDVNASDDVDDDDDGGDDKGNYDTSDSDYSYEDDDNQGLNKQNNYPSILSSTKTNVKRYTNPRQPIHKPFAASTFHTFYNHHNGHHSRHHTPSYNMAALRANTNVDNINVKNNDDDDDDGDNDDANNDYDGIESNEDNADSSSSISDESSDDEADDDKMSDEKWNKIEHEHYRKQLQHQRAMQALRSRRPSSNDNTPHTATTPNTNKFSLYSPSSVAASSTNNAAWAKRQTINDDASDNIYSRYYVPGSVTRKKEEELGSPAAILESRRQYALKQRQNKALASAHHRRIVTEGFCRLPQPRVERIRKDSWKIYTPHCTILHRCADDAGCCPSERQTCAPKRTKNVDLYFFVISLNETQGSIEKLTFVNHTECHCVERSKQRAPEYATSAAKDLSVNNNQIPYLRRSTILNCHCPNLFEKILQEDGYCRCDCSSGNMGCDWLKRGMEHFSMNDRKCIIEGRCKLPTCEYGHYIKKHGRCPRREERHLSADIDW